MLNQIEYQPEGDVAAMPDDLGADFHQLLLQRCQRTVPGLLRQAQDFHEVGEPIGRHFEQHWKPDQSSRPPSDRPDSNLAAS